MGKILQILIYSVLIISFFIVCGYFFKSCSSSSPDSIVDTAQEVTENITEAGGEVIAKVENATENLVEEFEGTEIDYSNNDDTEKKSFKTTPNKVEEIIEKVQEEPKKIEPEDEEIEEVKYLAQEEPEAKPVVKKELPTQSLGSGGNYLLITGNYSQEYNAESMVKRLKSLGFSKAEKVIFENSKYYTVIAGKYPTANAATSAQSGLGDIDSYVQRKRL